MVEDTRGVPLKPARSLDDVTNVAVVMPDSAAADVDALLVE